MPYMLGEFVVPRPLTPDRLNWLVYVLTQYGVSDAGGKQITQKQPVTDLSDRSALLNVLNAVIEEGSVADAIRAKENFRRFHGKGGFGG